mmetsp:Transcript_3118/g.3495  ORF Transcript_3118/g.3495 Transcript_3118/m.3495 type:complete len:232 (+) Transcript_3118:35-730(+)
MSEETGETGLRNKNSQDKGSENKQISVSDRLAKLQQLIRKKQESENLNKQELFKDYKQQKLKSIEYKKIEQKKLNAELEHEKLDSIEKGEDFERKQNWDWSIEDCEKWEKKTKQKGNNKKSGFQNFSKMAEQAYNKELLNLKVDKEAYDQQKNAAEKNKSSSDQLQMPKILPFSSKPSAADTNRLVRNIEEANNRRMKRRRNKDDEDDVNSYINDKNKQFNLKLNRQYDES